MAPLARRSDLGLVVLDAAPGGVPPLLPTTLAAIAERVRAASPQATVLIVGADPGARDSWEAWPACLGADLVLVDCGFRLGGVPGSQLLWADERHHTWLGSGAGGDAHEFFYQGCLRTQQPAAAPLLALDAALRFWEEVGFDTAQEYSRALAREARELLESAWGNDGQSQVAAVPQDMLGAELLVAMPQAIVECFAQGRDMQSAAARVHDELVQDGMTAREPEGSPLPKVAHAGAHTGTQ